MKRSSRFWLRPLAVLSIGAFLASCSGGGGSHPALPAAPNNTTAGTTSPSSATRTLVRSSKFESVTTKGAAFTGGQLTMHVVVNLRNGAGLADYAAGVSTPTDGRYRQYLTPQEIGERFGASTSDYRTVANYFASYGLRVGMWPQRLALTVAGPTARFEKALGTTFSTFTSREGVKLIGPSSG
ncbi:MAG TPA: protease pro-enzyme activation domain-containing protein, partial [Candidatus Elarobacter sp.]